MKITAYSLVALLFLTLVADAKTGTFYAVTDAVYKGNGSQKYPVFSGGNAAAAKEINSVVEKIVPAFMQRERDSYKEDIYVKSDYQVTYNYEDYLSIVFSFEYGLEGWPQNLERGYVFDSKTGRVLHAKDLHVTASAIKNKLHIMSNVKDIPLDANLKLNAVPNNFYYDNGFNLHFIFDKGSIAPEAYGIIDLNMDAY